MSYHVHKENGALVSVAFLKPRDMLEHILCTYPWALLGGLQPGPNAERMLNTFWKTYRLEHGSHAVYQMADANQVRLDRTIPLVLHGDGARTQKKQPLEVVSVCPVLGLDTEQSCLTCTCEKAQTYSGKRKRSPLAQRLNLKNSSYATHFLAFAIPSKKYKATPGLLKSLLGEVSENLGEVCKTGLEYQEGYRFHFAGIGMKGGPRISCEMWPSDQELHERRPGEPNPVLQRVPSWRSWLPVRRLQNHCLMAGYSESTTTMGRTTPFQNTSF